MKMNKEIIKVEKHSDWGDGLGPWAWYCLACAFFDFHDTWQVAYESATHHAHHHGSRE